MSLYSTARLVEKTDEELVASGTFPYFNQAQQLEPIASAVHAFDKAHTLMLFEEGLIPQEPARLILCQLLLMEEDNDVVQQRIATGEGIHSGEAYLRAKLGPEIAGHIHLGRSTPDLKGIPIRMAMRERLAELAQLTLDFRELLLSRAMQHKDVVMPSYDRVFQRGEATTFGSELLESLDPLERANERLEALCERVNRCPPYYINYLGFNTNSERIAELLGFEGRVETVLNWDDLVECLSVLVMLNRCLSGLAAKLGHWSSPEVRMVEIADRYCVTSSIRPQKRNPAAIEFIVVAEGTIIGCLTACTTLLRGIGAEAYQMSVLQLWPAMTLSKQALKVMIGVMSTLVMNKRQMRARAEEEWGQAPFLAARIVEKEGVPWRTAHQIVAEAARQSAESTTVQQVDPGVFNAIARTSIGRNLILTDDEIRHALSKPQVQNRVQHVRETVQRMRRQLRQDRKRLAMRQERLLKAEEKLKTSIAAFVQGAGQELSSADR